jgi:hypothetical protein
MLHCALGMPNPYTLNPKPQPPTPHHRFLRTSYGPFHAGDADCAAAVIASGERFYKLFCNECGQICLPDAPVPRDCNRASTS